MINMEKTIKQHKNFWVFSGIVTEKTTAWDCPLMPWWNSYRAMSEAKRRHIFKSDGTSLCVISLPSRRRTFSLEKFITSTTLQKLPRENSVIKQSFENNFLCVSNPKANHNFNNLWARTQFTQMENIDYITKLASLMYTYSSFLK